MLVVATEQNSSTVVNRPYKAEGGKRAIPLICTLHSFFLMKSMTFATIHHSVNFSESLLDQDLLSCSTSYAASFHG